MTSGTFDYIAVSSIIIDRENRQRRELTGIPELAKSIADNGLINPIVITRDLVLVAGERRLTAHKHLGFDLIAVQYLSDLDDEQTAIIELEENIRREDLPWQDHVKAVSRFHEIRSKQAAATNQTWSQDATAAELGMSQANIAKHLLVKKAMDLGIKDVIDSPKLTTAANFAGRLQERKKTTLLRELRQEPSVASVASDLEGDLISPDDEPPATSAPTRYAEIINTNFLAWSLEVREFPYNVIHCDFPYGISAGDTIGQSSAKSFGGYLDSADIYWELLETFLARQDRFVAPSAHMLFWFSMKYYTPTVQKLRAAGWRVDDFPLIWHRSDNAGILPDAQRGPRRTYETALFCTRGDRKTVKAVANSIAAVTTKNYHMSEKPMPVLEHFFRMIIDETSLVLDPTCGSGNAIKAAEAAGANWATGLELSPDYAEGARQNLGL
jgi:ParB/RepB/Spo0J family partition protein